MLNMFTHASLWTSPAFELRGSCEESLAQTCEDCRQLGRKTWQNRRLAAVKAFPKRRFDPKRRVLGKICD